MYNTVQGWMRFPGVRAVKHAHKILSNDGKTPGVQRKGLILSIEYGAYEDMDRWLEDILKTSSEASVVSTCTDCGECCGWYWDTELHAHELPDWAKEFGLAGWGENRFDNPEDDDDESYEIHEDIYLEWLNDIENEYHEAFFKEMTCLQSATTPA